MKKLGIALLVILLAVGGFIYVGLSGLDGFIDGQLETQGSKITQTRVNVEQIETQLTNAKVSITGLSIGNPEGYSAQNAFSMNAIRLDLGTSTQEPYVIEELLIDSPTVLYEVDKQGKANLIVLKENVQSALPQSEKPAESTSKEATPLMRVNNITVKDVRFMLDIAALDFGELPLEKRQYEMTLPTFYADAIGVPDGIPADQLGAAVVNAMLDNLIKEGKNKVKDIVAEQAKAKLDEEKDKLAEKAKEKLKSLFDN